MNTKEEYELLRLWVKRVPPLYRGTDEEFVPDIQEVKDWKYNPLGILLVGPPGTFKTRLLYLLLKRLHFQKYSWIAFGANGLFGDVCAHEYVEGRGPEWVQKCIETDILFFEDMGKEKITDRTGEALYQVVEGRVAHLRPIIAGCESKSITQISESVRGESIIRRISESSIVVRTEDGLDSKISKTDLMRTTQKILTIEQARLQRLRKESLKGQ